MRVVGIDHVQLAMPAGAEGKDRAFYGMLLGLHEIPKPGGRTARGSVWFPCGDLPLHLGVDADLRPTTKAHPAPRVEGYPELLSLLKRAGYEVVIDSALPGVSRSFPFDSFGNRIELIARDV